MKKFVRFEWGRYYPQGGMIDIAGSFDSIEEAKSAPYDPRGDNYEDPNIQIVDRDSWEIVWASGDGLEDDE